MSSTSLTNLSHFKPVQLLSKPCQRQYWQHSCKRASTTKVFARSQQDDSNLSRLELEVPVDQRPVNELNELKNSPLFSWATLDLNSYIKRLGILYGGFLLVVSGPIANQTFDPTRQPAEFVLAASTGALLVVAAACFRMYIGWKYIADRLMTATLEYEESGWYDGQYFVKPPEILTRDRLLGTYEVKPLMSRLRTTLQLVGGSLAVNALLFAVVVNGGDGTAVQGAVPRPISVSPNGVLYSKSVGNLDELITDDEAAEAEAAAQNGIPGYCGDRHFKALAGGEEVCSKLAREARE